MPNIVRWDRAYIKWLWNNARKTTSNQGGGMVEESTVRQDSDMVRTDCYDLLDWPLYPRSFSYQCLHRSHGLLAVTFPYPTDALSLQAPEAGSSKVSISLFHSLVNDKHVTYTALPRTLLNSNGVTNAINLGFITGMLWSALKIPGHVAAHHAKSSFPSGFQPGHRARPGLIWGYEQAGEHSAGKGQIDRSWSSSSLPKNC